jgi:cell division protease FtsH
MKNKQKKQTMKKVEIKFNLNLKRVAKMILLVLGFLFIVSFLNFAADQGEMSLSQLVQQIREEKVEQVVVNGELLEVHYKDSEDISFVRKEPFDSFLNVLNLAKIDFNSFDLVVRDQGWVKIWSSILEIFLPIVLTGVIFLFIFRQMKGAQNSVFDFGKNKAKLFIKGKQDIRFKDVGGVEEVKQELEEVVDFLKHPKKYQALGAKTPKGVLLVGPAGTGKTLLARAVAGEASVTFFSMAGSEFMEMLVGVGASRVRDLFNTAKKASPAIIFIDEIDAIGRQRGSSFSGGHDEREQTLNQILVEMDGFTPRDNVIVIAATNRADLLDSALLRPGRFDRRVVLDLPDIEGRKQILKIHARGKPFTKDVSWDKVAKRTVGFSGADLENMLNEGAISAARDGKKTISYKHIDEAASKVKLGPTKRRLQSKDERRMTAYHEAGHAVCAFYMKHTDPVHRVSIVSRAMSLGQTEVPPERDKYHETKLELLDNLVMYLGGRSAEEIEFKDISGGAASDIEQATKVARRMVVDYGMSKLGPINFGPQVDTNNWRRSLYRESSLSEKMQAKVDDEIKIIIDNAHSRALETLKKNKKKMDLIASKLIEKEVLERDEFEKLMKSK